MKSLIPVRRNPLFSLSLSALILLLPHAHAQNADDYFHGGAQHFLTNNIPAALEVVTNGLQRFPEDEKLQKLYELLNQQQQQQQQNQDQKQQNDQKDEQKQDQQKQDAQKDQESKSEQQKKDEEKKQQDAQKQESEKKDQPEEKTGEPQQITAHQMRPEEAKQLLDAQKDDEQVLIFQPQGEPKNRTKQLKDW
jgi:outer membrane biosynthesis protein TonB